MSTLQDYRKATEARPDIFILSTFPPLQARVLESVAQVLHVPADEVVFVQNATSGKFIAEVLTVIEMLA